MIHRLIKKQTEKSIKKLLINVFKIDCQKTLPDYKE